MSSSQCRYIDYQALCCDVNESLLPFNFQLYILEDPLILLCTNNGSLYDNQGKKDIYNITNFVTSNRITGNRLMDNIKAHKLELGCSGPLFSNNLKYL